MNEEEKAKNEKIEIETNMEQKEQAKQNRNEGKMNEEKAA